MAILRLPERAFYYGIANFHEQGHAWLSTAYNLITAIAAHRWYRNPKLSNQIPELQTALLVGDVVEIGFGLKTVLEKFSLLPSLNPTEWNQKQIVYLGLGSLAILSAGYVAVRVLRKAGNYLMSKSDPPGIRRLDFSSLEKNLHLARMVLNFSLAYFSSNRIFYLCNVAAEAYSLLTLSKIRYLEFSKTFPNVPISKIFPPAITIRHADGGGTQIQTIGENSLRAQILRRPRVQMITVNNIHTAIETNYRGLFFPYTGPRTECAVCFEEKPDVYFCSSHAYHLTCMHGFVQTEMEKPINFELLKIFFKSTDNISITNEGLPRCPECRGLPLQVDFKLHMQSNLNLTIDYVSQFRGLVLVNIFNGVTDLSIGENQQIPVQFEIDAPKAVPSPLFSEAFFDRLSLAYNTLQVALTTMQHLHPELASAIFTAQKVFMVIDSLWLAKNYLMLLDKIQKKYNIKLDFDSRLMTVVHCTLGIISAFAVYQLNSRIIPPIDLNEIMKKIAPSTKAEWHTPFLKHLIAWLYINRIAINLASTFFVSKDRLPIHLMNIGLQAVSLFKFFSLLLPFIKLGRYDRGAEFYFMLPLHPAENSCSLNESGHLHTTLKSLHEYCSNFFENSSWPRWIPTSNGISDYYWEVKIQPPSLNPLPCGLVPTLNSVQGAYERIIILNK